jgi:hypothetical protein
MCVNARNGGCKKHALILQMMGNQFIRAVAQKQWMLEQPIDEEKRCQICLLDGKYVRKVLCLDLCKHHFWRFCGNGSDKKWSQMMFVDSMLVLAPDAAYQKRLEFLENLYDVKSKSKAGANKQEMARRKRMLEIDQEIFKLQQRMDVYSEMSASPDRDQEMEKLQQEIDAMEQEDMDDV